MSLLRQEFVGFDTEDVGLDWVSLAFEDNMVCAEAGIVGVCEEEGDVSGV